MPGKYVTCIVILQMILSGKKSTVYPELTTKYQSFIWNTLLI